MTDNVDTYNFATLDINDTNREPPYPIIDINRKGNENPTTNPSNPIYLVIINLQG